MQALWRRGTSLFGSTPSESPKDTGAVEDFQTASSPERLFTKVDPSVDGEECLHDCASCTVRYPAKFDVDYEDTLYGNVNGWATHLLVATGKTDWVRDVADEQGSVMEAIEKGGIEPSNGKLKLSASNMPVPDEYHHHESGKQPTTVLLLPSFTIIDHVTPTLASDLIKYFVSPAPTTTTPLGAEPLPTAEQPESDDQPQTPSTDLLSLTPLRPRPCHHAAVILLCSQRTRDARCGQSAPLLRKEFERHLRPLGLYRDLDDERPGGVGIYFISHVGGHKYSANVIVYRRRDFEWHRKQGIKDEPPVEGEEGAAQGIWLARVRPEDCENIIKYTVLKGKVVKPEQVRGGFDRERGLTSW
ncbi:Sucrase/ferredoxin-like-domain-containing protein [Aspergillus leporis]|uniref:Sucrase/ferredoxin-like-domain-containing protein n=1 Tax=Aspergillus leporis TaxID=41062 RepID=A0A5N5X3Y2_9EURO|nr:Sucrase/ferredoxin-like-domain-containing protein [Aspergillus leporis]